MAKVKRKRPQFVSPLTDPGEKTKRRREVLAVIILCTLFIFLTWVEFRLFDTAKSLPFVHSIFFFGLVNFNIIIFLLLIFFIFRNVVKVFTDRRDGIFGGALKSKLVAAFVSFSVIPTLLMLLISVFYINNSFDKWFSEKVTSVLKSSLEVTNAYYKTAKKKNYHFAFQIADRINPSWSKDKIKNEIKGFQKKFSLDSIEFYPDLFSERVVVVNKQDGVPKVPEISLEFMKKGLVAKSEASTIHHFGRGNLIRVIVPAKKGQGAFVVSSFIPLSLISKMDDIAAAYQDFKSDNPIEYPIKSIYLIILFLMTLTILLCASWFGFYLAKQLSVPLEILGEATRNVAKGDYEKVNITTGQNEINELILNFNSMTEGLELSQSELKDKNAMLSATLEQLDKHSRYIEVVLSNVSTGVISIDETGLVTMVNHHAEKLLGLKSSESLGMNVKGVLGEYYDTFYELYNKLSESDHKLVEKQLELSVLGKSLPVHISATQLKDDKGSPLGTVFVVDDLTDVLRAQRAAAWSEVARRIAHEIKNPLTPIKLSAQRLQKKFGKDISDTAFSDCTEMIIEQVDDLKNLVNEFGEFSRLPQTKKVSSNVNSIIEQSLSLFQLAQKKVTLSFEKDTDIPMTLVDADQMKRAFTNLIKNSFAALEGQESGEIKISTKYNANTSSILIEFTDNGHGIDQKMMDRIFEPYVTTKEHGTGLGLAIVRKTIEEHGGAIQALANKQVSGITMAIELPVIDSMNSKDYDLKNIEDKTEGSKLC